MKSKLIISLFIAANLAGCIKDQNAVATLRFYRSDVSISKVTKVVMVELNENLGYPDIAKKMTRTIAAKLSERGKFHIHILDYSHPDLRDLNLKKRTSYSIRELATIRKALKCDAILFGRIHSYTPYPRHLVGVQLRLVDLAEGQVVWAIDDVWDSTNKSISKRIDNYYFDEKANSFAPVKSEYACMSSNAFHDFIAHEISRTMDVNDAGDSRRMNYLIRPSRQIGKKIIDGTINVINDF